MAKKNNPLSGMTASQIRDLVESADITDDLDDDSDNPLEIIIKGKDARTVLEHLGIITEKNYKPDDDETEEPEEEEPVKKTGKSLADRIFGAEA